MKVEDRRDESGEDSPKKKPRITLARGGACVLCRTKKLKCTGDQPCKSCRKSRVECRYEEVPKRKPRALLLEERVVELEDLLSKIGQPVPPSNVALRTQPSSDAFRGSIGPSSSTPILGGHQPDSAGSVSADDTLHALSRISPTFSHTSHSLHAPVDIPPQSHLETALIHVVLPHTPFLGLPVHPQRMLALLQLPPDDPRRPHPSLLYIMFTQAVKILEEGSLVRTLPTAPPTFFPQPQYPAALSEVDKNWVLQQLRGTSNELFERSRAELAKGISNVDRIFDLARASVGIARYMIANGRFMDCYTLPITQLAIACGLHRLSGNIVPPDGTTMITGDLPQPYASPYQYQHTHALPDVADALPILRMKPIVVPPPRDEIDLAERAMTFWAVKYQDWEASVGWGWAELLPDEECTTMLPWGWGTPEPRSPHMTSQSFALKDLWEPHSPMNTSPCPDTTFTLAIKSMALLQRASILFDHPLSEFKGARTRPIDSIPPLSAIQNVESALHRFRNRIPAPFQDTVPSYPTPPSENYDGPADPWWVTLHANLLTAEMLMWREMANHQRSAYEQSVSCARGMVAFVGRLRPESYSHLPLIVTLDISLAARFLNKESSRLANIGHVQPASAAADEAEILRSVLANELSKWSQVASLHALIIQRVKEGRPEKEGEYERV